MQIMKKIKSSAASYTEWVFQLNLFKVKIQSTGHFIDQPSMLLVLRRVRMRYLDLVAMSRLNKLSFFHQFEAFNVSRFIQARMLS